ncbi:hypothetical protein PIB30_063331, partial [Stylosanthes scabra]|nr:hypothetical protein [Stylosanthes scabra]
RAKKNGRSSDNSARTQETKSETTRSLTNLATYLRQTDVQRSEIVERNDGEARTSRRTAKAAGQRTLLDGG